jgi:hypothetical protein
MLRAELGILSRSISLSVSAERASRGERSAHVYLLFCLKRRRKIRHRRGDGSDLGLDFVAALLAELMVHALVVQTLATGFQLTDMLSDGFIHPNRVAYKHSEHGSTPNNRCQAGG